MKESWFQINFQDLTIVILFYQEKNCNKGLPNNAKKNEGKPRKTYVLIQA